VDLVEIFIDPLEAENLKSKNLADEHIEGINTELG
jgi:hypothetical protein